MDPSNQVTASLQPYFTKDEQFPNLVYIFGQNPVGISSDVRSFLSSAKDWITSASIDATECYVSKSLFEFIINAFNNYHPSEENNYEPYAKVDSGKIEDFLHQLSLMDSAKSYLIVIESAEKLQNMEFNILPVLERLQEFTGLNISCLFISHIPMEKLKITGAIKIHVPDLNKAEVANLIALKFNETHRRMVKTIKRNEEIGQNERARQLEEAENLDMDFFMNYLSIFLNVFYKTCRDVSELQSLALKYFPFYYAPVISGEIKSTDVTNLWRNITKVLKVNTANSAFSRIANLTSSDQVNEETDQANDKRGSIRAFAQTLEMPYYAKYLLIASFLASHNDAKSDKRLFMKHHGKQRKRPTAAKVSEKMNVQFGPKSFTIDRLLAIFYAILDEKVGLTCNLLSQISTLVDLNFLTFTSGENNIIEGNARLQSTIGLDFATNIGKVVGFNLKQYLTDFH